MAGTSKEAEAMKQLALPVLRQRSPDFPSHALEVSPTVVDKDLLCSEAER